MSRDFGNQKGYEKVSVSLLTAISHLLFRCVTNLLLVVQIRERDWELAELPSNLRAWRNIQNLNSRRNQAIWSAHWAVQAQR
jgi:hypothetical protein